jgi:nucleoside-diphosphate-sugar epimerase
MSVGIGSLRELEDRLSQPTAGVVQALGSLRGDIVVLGAGGKMGPSLARMARRASDAAGVKRKVIAVSRFSNRALVAELKEEGVEPIACDLLDEQAVAGLPEAPNVVYMAGMKFGTSGHEPMTWALNAFLPGVACRRYRGSRIVAFSSGNVYGLVPVASRGSREADEPSPAGEYAWSVLGRDRIFQHFSASAGTPVVLLRLNYACELRYGVLVDIAQRVRDGQPVSLAMGWLNTIWQGDANAMALQALPQTASPARILNLTGPEMLRVREVAEKLGRILGKPVRFEGQEADSALLSDARAAHGLFGPPAVTADTLLQWVAGWVGRGGESLGKPTHFENRDGRF